MIKLVMVNAGGGFSGDGCVSSDGGVSGYGGVRGSDVSGEGGVSGYGDVRGGGIFFLIFLFYHKKKHIFCLNLTKSSHLK